MGRFTQGLVELHDVGQTDTVVLSEQTEVFAVLVKMIQVHHILVDFEQFAVLACADEKRRGVSAFDRVLKRGWLVVGSRGDTLDMISHSEGLEVLSG